MISSVVAAVAAYLLGSISFSYVIVRLLKGIDLRTVGSGNAGATNVLRVAGKLPALVALLLDVSKGAVAVLVASGLGVAGGGLAVVALLAVVGHIYPVFMGFRGGKGVATAAGTMAALLPWPTLAAAIVFLVAVVATRFVSLGSILAGVGLALGATGAFFGVPRDSSLFAAGGRDALLALVAVLVLCGLIVFKHRENLSRLVRGEENRLGSKARTTPSGEDSGR